MAKKSITTKTATELIPDEMIMNKIYVIRDQKVMLDKDLAELYGVSTKVFNQAVKRNIRRFPKDFMFELTPEEFDELRSHFVTSKKGGTRYLPSVFTEQGVAMLASILNTDTAIDINIRIIRVFTRIRKMMMDQTEMWLILEETKKRAEGNSERIETLFKYLDELLDEKHKMEEKTYTPVGYRYKIGKPEE